MDTTTTEQTVDAPIISPAIILSIILIEGFITISVEILTIRQLIPFVGSSVTVTSLIIGVFLLFLAYGYKRGGIQQDCYAEKLNFNFTVSAFILGAGLSYAMIDLFFLGMNQVFRPHLLVTLSIYLLLVTAPLVYLLGQTVPITMNLIRQTSTVGHVGGKVLHLSTVGSFLGAVLTSVALLTLFGVSKTVFINYALLLLLTVLVTYAFKQPWMKVIILALSGFLVYKLNVQFESIAFIKTNTYANYAVHDDFNNVYDTKGKVFAINKTPASYINDQNQGFHYIEMIKRFMFYDLGLKDADILVLGAGGFTLSKGIPQKNKFTYVDIDPEIKQIVQENFISDIQGDVVPMDARVFVKNHDKQYDAVLVDVYSDPSSMPKHLTTKEYFEDIHELLKEGGTAFFNFIVNPMFATKYSKRLDTTVRTVFKSCLSIPIDYKDKPTNVVYVCSKLPNEFDETIYTDDLNLSEIDTPLPR